MIGPAMIDHVHNQDENPVRALDLTSMRLKFERADFDWWCSQGLHFLRKPAEASAGPKLNTCVHSAALAQCVRWMKTRDPPES